MKLSDQLIALGGIFIVVILGFGLFFWLSPRTENAVQAFTKDQMVAPYSAMTGTTTAKVTMVEWGDFECPACASVEPVLKQIIAIYGKNPEFNFVFRNFPLPQHPNARPAAEAAEAAGAQGQYWGMYALLYEHQDEWVKSANPRTSFDTYAKSLQLDLATFDAALNNHIYASLIDLDSKNASELRLNHTPTIFLNGVEQKMVSIPSLTKAIDTALKQ